MRASFKTKNLRKSRSMRNKSRNIVKSRKNYRKKRVLSKKKKINKRRRLSHKGGAANIKNDVLINTMCQDLDETEIKDTKIYKLVKGICSNNMTGGTNIEQQQLNSLQQNNAQQSIIPQNNILINVAKKILGVATLPLKVAIGTMTKITGLNPLQSNGMANSTANGMANQVSNNQGLQDIEKMKQIQELQESIKNNQKIINENNQNK